MECLCDSHGPLVGQQGAGKHFSHGGDYVTPLKMTQTGLYVGEAKAFHSLGVFVD